MALLSILAAVELCQSARRMFCFFRFHSKCVALRICVRVDYFVCHLINSFKSDDIVYLYSLFHLKMAMKNADEEWLESVNCLNGSNMKLRINGPITFIIICHSLKFYQILLRRLLYNKEMEKKKNCNKYLRRLTNLQIYCDVSDSKQIKNKQNAKI